MRPSVKLVQAVLFIMQSIGFVMAIQKMRTVFMTYACNFKKILSSLNGLSTSLRNSTPLGMRMKSTQRLLFTWEFNSQRRCGKRLVTIDSWQAYSLLAQVAVQSSLPAYYYASCTQVRGLQTHAHSAFTPLVDPGL